MVFSWTGLPGTLRWCSVGQVYQRQLDGVQLEGLPETLRWCSVGQVYQGHLDGVQLDRSTRDT